MKPQTLTQMRWFVLFVWITPMLTSGQDTANVIGSLIQQAEDHVAAEDVLLAERFRKGVDKRAEDFMSVESVMFEDTAEKAQEIETASRLINWIAFLIRRDNLTISLQDVLGYPDSPVSCPFIPPPECEPSKYRSIDGTCNNMRNPLQGASFTPFVRDLDPVYESAPNHADIDDQPRTKGKFGDLPGARTVSRMIHQQGTLAKTDGAMSFFFTAWGQFLAHTVTDRAVPSGSNSSKLDCCSQTHPSPQAECFNIDIPSGDPLRDSGRSCLPLIRTLEATDILCKKGEMATSMPDELPYRSHGNHLAERQGFSFVQAGDPRAAEVMPLLGMHTLWIREHNRIARTLAQHNPNWDDEMLYQETRRLVSAMIQHITYTEWLPPLLGPTLMRKYNLRGYRYGFFTSYNANIDASTSNVVSTAAFRFGHSMVAPNYPLCQRDYTVLNSPALQLKDLFLRPNVYLLNEQTMMRGLLVQRSQPMDPFITSDLANKLQETRQDNGVDLVALNIQRAREHGLAPYNSWRRSLNLTTSSSFTSLPDIPAATTEALASVYGHPDDIDVWTGGVAEEPVTGGLIGPLFGNILGRQFERYKRGDRFWYETGRTLHAFTSAQLAEIRRVTLARIICDNFDVDTIQPEAFKLSSVQGNERIACDDIPRIDLSHWQE
ncbi:peroxinectin A-like isoform X2 [Liolophura sinensis]|uniref:peroxinectin A-like isoform X2 n=1 Tax=Liolophura sinensis TaxID=3198878 RepID=UPI00315903DB